MESLLSIKIEGINYLGRFQHSDLHPTIENNSEIILLDPVVLEMMSIPAINPLTTKQEMAAMIQINHIHTEQIFIQLSFNYAYWFYSLEDNTNQIVQLYKNSWITMRKQSKGVH